MRLVWLTEVRFSSVEWCCFPSPPLRVGLLGFLLLFVVLPSSPSFGWGLKKRGKTTPPNRRDVKSSPTQKMGRKAFFVFLDSFGTNSLFSVLPRYK